MRAVLHGAHFSTLSSTVQINPVFMDPNVTRLHDSLEFYLPQKSRENLEVPSDVAEQTEPVEEKSS